MARSFCAGARRAAIAGAAFALVVFVAGGGSGGGDRRRRPCRAGRRSACGGGAAGHEFGGPAVASRAARRSAAIPRPAGAVGSSPLSTGWRRSPRLLSIRRAGVRRRPCRAAVAAPCGRRSGGVDRPGQLPCRLRRRAGNARPALHLLSRLSRRCDARTAPNGVAGGLLGLGAIFLPGLLALVAALPFWDVLRRPALAPRRLCAVQNAAVVGILGAALYNPLWTGAVLSPLDFALAALAGFVLLVAWTRAAAARRRRSRRRRASALAA